MRLNRMLSVAGGFVGITALTVLAAAPGAAATTCTGSAQVISTSASVLGALKVQLASTEVDYPPSSKNALLDLGLIGKDAGLAKLKLVDARSEIEQGNLVSVANVADLDLLGLVHADLLTASCKSNANGVTGTSDIAGVSIGGKPVSNDAIHAKITANNPIALNNVLAQLLAPLNGAVSIVFDEHKWDGDKLTVNALHVHIDTALLGLPALAKSDIVISSASCTKGDVPGGGTGTGSGSPTTGPTTPGNGGGTTTTPATTTASAPTAATTTAPAVANASDNKNLPFTGVADILPMLIGAVVLVAAGVGLFLFNRKRAARAGAGSDS